VTEASQEPVMQLYNNPRLYNVQGHLLQLTLVELQQQFPYYLVIGLIDLTWPATTTSATWTPLFIGRTDDITDQGDNKFCLPVPDYLPTQPHSYIYIYLIHPELMSPTDYYKMRQRLMLSEWPPTAKRRPAPASPRILPYP
jgi:hypothetical protein